MKKHNNKKQKSRKAHSKALLNIEASRTGGQIALRGFNYQMLFSCYSILTNLTEPKSIITLEGIEDLDLYRFTQKEGQTDYHIQLKYSTQEKYDASSITDVLKNFLEVYLLGGQSKKRFFKLVFDAKIAKGNLSSLIEKKMDEKSIEFWQEKIQKIQKEKSNWNWVGFDFLRFVKQLKFEYFPQKNLKDSLRTILIQKYLLTTGNEQLFVKSLFYTVYQASLNREDFTNQRLKQLIQDIKDDISKGDTNPAFQWIEKISFDSTPSNHDKALEYYKGRKATVEDIISGFPVRRKSWEKIIEESIDSNTITVLKASSGQGKTTLAWQVTHNLRSQYTVYQLNWCRENKELNNIVEYFNSRLKLGEQILVVLDNLDEESSEWNRLVQQMESKLKVNYKILITTREEDWYSYSGDQSNLGRLKIVDLAIDKKQAQDIYENLDKGHNLHKDCQNWQGAWEQIKDKQLLIEYIYLLTQGEMLEKRLEAQIKNISEQNDSKLTLSVLRSICLADIMGIKLSIKNLCSYYEADLNHTLKSIEKEYLIKVSENQKYIEGLHPVRSMHLNKLLHEFYPIEKTLESVIEMVDDSSTGHLYSQLSLYLDSEELDFYIRLAAKDACKDYAYLTNAVKGLFSGSVIQYYNANKKTFDNANERAGLFLLANEINPWNDARYGVEVKTLQEMHKIMPENENIKALLKLSSTVPRFDLQSSVLYFYTQALYEQLSEHPMKKQNRSYAILAKWLLRIDEKFNLLAGVNIEQLWTSRDSFEVDELAQFFFEFYKLKRKTYDDFFNMYKEEILSYLRIITESVEIIPEGSEIEIKYILLPQDINKANEQSVKRIDIVCKFLPFFEKYNTKGITPKIDIFPDVNTSDPSIKNMPFRNVSLSFNSDLSSLWNDTLLSNYEFSSIYDLQYFWIKVRKELVDFFMYHNKILGKKLKLQPIGKKDIIQILEIRNNIFQMLNPECFFPNEKKNKDNEIIVKNVGIIKEMKQGYFSSINNYIRQVIPIINKDTANNIYNIALVNLRNTVEQLPVAQKLFRQLCNNTEHYFETGEIEHNESICINKSLLLVQYHLDHEPSEFFSFNSIYTWEEQQKKTLIDGISKTIDIATEMTSIKYLKPSRIYFSKSLKTVPIGIYNYDFSNAEQNNEIIVSLMPLNEIDVNYIVLIPLNKNNKAKLGGIKINNNFLKQLKLIIEGELEEIDENRLQLFPFNVTREYLDCFAEDIELENMVAENFGMDIFIIALWHYSLLHDYSQLRVGNEKEYLQKKLNKIEKDLFTGFKITDFPISQNYIEDLISLKEAVITKNHRMSENEVDSWMKIIIEQASVSIINNQK